MEKDLSALLQGPVGMKLSVQFGWLCQRTLVIQLV